MLNSYACNHKTMGFKKLFTMSNCWGSMFLMEESRKLEEIM